ncbi:MAG: hypothetical protein V9G20_26630 [Candidatus Promineifilaceae bacterium]
MLHKINLPHSWKNLQWILALQHRLLVKLCEPTLTPDQVTTEWVANIFSKLPTEWVTSFCNRTFEKSTLLTRMKSIAGLDTPLKAQLLADFEHDVNFRGAIADAHISFHFHSLQAITDESTRQELRNFFESFYSAQFYFAANNSRSGYYISNQRGTSVRYHHTQFLEDFHHDQTVRVCSFCDGALSGVQVDHFYPKSNQPFLSCHPLNLTPICGECNKAKLQGEPMDHLQDGGNAFVHWAHPYLRPLAGSYTIGFVRDTEPLRPKLLGQDDLTNVRLERLDNLIGLNDRWLQALKNKVHYTQEIITRHRRRLQKQDKNSVLNQVALVEKLSEWAETLPSVGEEPDHLLWKAYLEQAAGQNPIIYEELAQHSQAEMSALA